MEFLTPTYAYLNADRSYLARSFSPLVKQRCRLFHRIFVQRAVERERYRSFLSDPIELFRMECGGETLIILMRVTRDEYHEGELTVVMRLGDQRLYRIGFNFIPGDAVGLAEPETLLIGRMQGGRNVFEEIRAATKALNDVAPQAAVMAALDGVARTFALRVVVGVSALNNCAYKEDETAGFHHIYDAFYEAIGAGRLGDDFFSLPVPLPQKDVSTVKAGHRIRTRRKQEMKERIAASASQATRAAFDASFLRERDRLRAANAPQAGPRIHVGWLQSRAPQQDLRAQLAKIEREIADAKAPEGIAATLLHSKSKFLRRWAARREVKRLKRLQFDEPFYAQRNSDVDMAGLSAVKHFVMVGRREGRPARFRLQLTGWTLRRLRDEKPGLERPQPLTYPPNPQSRSRRRRATRRCTVWNSQPFRRC